jgi:hypothetical protein
MIRNRSSVNGGDIAAGPLSKIGLGILAEGVYIAGKNTFRLYAVPQGSRFHGIAKTAYAAKKINIAICLFHFASPPLFIYSTIRHRQSQCAAGRNGASMRSCGFGAVFSGGRFNEG